MCNLTFTVILNPQLSLMWGAIKVLQLGYKKLTYIIYTIVFWHILQQHQCIFSTFLLSRLWLEFAVITLNPCLDSDRQWFIICKPGSTKMALQISYYQMITGSKVWIVGRMVQLNKFTVAESLLSDPWLVRWCIVMKTQTAKWELSSLFLLDDIE